MTEPGQSYAEWLATAARPSASGATPALLVGSSVPEPTGLLLSAIQDVFRGGIDQRYASTFSGGSPEIIARLAARYAVPADNIICTTGAASALDLLFRTYLGPWDAALIERPAFDLIAQYAADTGARIDRFDRAAPVYDIDPADIEARLRPETRLVVLTNLHNPSGMPISPGALGALGAMAERRGILVIVDEVYGEYADARARPSHAAAFSPAIIGVNSLTKMWGLSTLRCGWIIGAPETIAAARERSRRSDFTLSNLSHAVACAVLDRSADFDAFRADILAQCRPAMEAHFRRWISAGLVEGHFPDHGCIALARLPGDADDLSFAGWLAAEHGVIVSPGSFFAAPGHFRIGLPTVIADLDRGLSSLEAGLTQWPTASAHRGRR